MTYLCVSIFVTDAAQTKRDMALAGEAGADMIELRVDRMSDAQEMSDVVASATVPCIVTCRPVCEGGQSQLGEDERIELLRQATETDTAYVDLELKAVNHADSILSIPRDNRPGLIISAHDFTGRPARLANIVLDMSATAGDVNKIVWQARTIRDNLEALELLIHRTKPTIAFCMGEAGIISRILCKKFCGFLTFASLSKETGTASGQIPIADMKRLYRWDAIGPKTKVYGVVGSPIMHSMSPAIHNAAFDASGHDGLYLPLLVEAEYECFKAFMESFLHFEGLELAGLSVTIPHKENALRYLKEKGAEVEELAERIGAVNTIVISPSPGIPGEGRGEGPRLRGLNTDYAAILDSITEKLAISREQLADYRVAVIGAGGTGRTAVAALAQCGATVVVYNRTKERADALASEFDGKSGRVVSARMEKLCDSCCHIYINTTSVGMYPKMDESPLGERTPKFEPGTVVFDTIYNPSETKLLKQARQAGAQTVSGVDMFVLQAAAQFQAWTNLQPPVAVMRKVLEARLSAT